MKTGTTFDIKEMAVHDGPGLRLTVFLKGCPLRCRWCHNPEGLDLTIQQVASGNEVRPVGRVYRSTDLANLLNTQVDVLQAIGGGVTFSGGEPLMQAPFLCEVIDQLHDTHLLLDTAGFGSTEDFLQVLSRVNYVYYDLKLIDDDEHRYWTGMSNQPILRNLQTMDHQGKPYTLRFPLIPAITDTETNLNKLVFTIQNLRNASELHVLPYNVLAGGKYETYHKNYTIGNDPNTPESIDKAVDILQQLDVKIIVKNAP